jgi:hypothetical protein
MPCEVGYVEALSDQIFHYPINRRPRKPFILILPAERQLKH